MDQFKYKLSLDRPMTYEIQVPGHLDENMIEESGLSIGVNYENDGTSISILMGSFDQAALLGLLRRLNSHGIPLISVICVQEN